MAENTTELRADAAGDLESLNALRQSPAGHLAEEMAAAEVTGERSFKLWETPFVLQIGVRAVPGSASAQALETELGIPLPTKYSQVTGDPQGVHAIWLSPDEFLVVDAAEQQAPGQADALAEALTGLPGQVLDLSANRTLLTVTGTASRAVLEKGCPADLHPRAFALDSAIVTQLGPVPVILHRTGENEFRIYPRGSFADYTVRWLLDASIEFAGEEVR